MRASDDPEAVDWLTPDTLSVDLEPLSTVSNRTERIFERIPWTSIDPQGRLRPLRDEAIPRRPNAADLSASERMIAATAPPLDDPLSCAL